MPNPLEEENTKLLRKKIVSMKADIGIGFDGDADRLYICDEKGNTVSADFVACIVSRKVLAAKPGSMILHDVRLSRVAGEEVVKAGGKFGLCRVGHSFIKRAMRKEDAEFAAEFAAHYYLKDNFFIEAPFFVILKVLETMQDEKKSLSELVKPFRRYFSSGEVNFTVKDKDAIIAAITTKYTGGKNTTIDGLRVDYKDWWFNVRPSNTEPLLRLMLEANTKQLLDEKLKELSKLIKGSG